MWLDVFPKAGATAAWQNSLSDPVLLCWSDNSAKTRPRFGHGNNQFGGNKVPHIDFL